MAGRDRTSQKKQTSQSHQHQTTIPSVRPFTDSTQETAISPKAEGVASSFNFSQITNIASQPSVQAKLTIGQPGDKYEQEADRVAKDVVQQINSPRSSQPEDNIQRSPAEVSNLRKRPVQRQSSIPVGSASNEFESNLNQARQGGSHLQPAIQTKMESAMGADFSQVKIHTGTQADQLSRSIQAKAFTTGQDVFFKQGAYDPSSRGGQELLAHELTHVVQQGGAATAIQRDTEVEERLLTAGGISAPEENTKDNPLLVPDPKDPDKLVPRHDMPLRAPGTQDESDPGSRFVPLMAKAFELLQEEYKPKLEAVASAVGGTASIPALKGRARSEEKTTNDYDEDAGRLVDVLRGSVVCETPEQVLAAWDGINSRFKVIRVKNNFATPKGGYRDIMANVEFAGGYVGEVQVQLAKIQEYKSGRGHELYDKIRALEPKEENNTLTAEETRNLQEWRQEMQEGYDAAFEAAQSIG
ncbi:MAG: DUF4157 domain-containing protein [Cyanobacteria bacterium P01_D01_bin.56]